MRSKYHLRLRAPEIFLWFLASVAVLSSNWASDAVLDTFNLWLSGSMGTFSLSRSIHVGIFTLSAVALFLQRHRFFPPRTRYLTNEDAEKRKHLFLFLSVSDLQIDDVKGIPDRLELMFDNIDSDLERMRKIKENGMRWNWEMPVRAMGYHSGILETVTLICSTQSLRQVHLFLNICKRYNQLRDVKFYLLLYRDYRLARIDTALIGNGKHFEFGSFDGFEGLNFESFDELTQALLYLISKFKKEKKDIMIDITGGQKPTSIVGASVTFNQEIKAQYIQTGGENRVLSYDVILTSSDTGGFGA